MYPHPVTSVLHALSFCSHPMPLWGLSLIACANAILSREVHLLDWWIQTGGFVNTYITIVVKQDMAAYGISKLYNLDVEWTELRSCFFFFLLIFGFTWNEVSMFWSQYWGIWMHIELRYLKKKHRRWLMVFILFRSIQFVLNLYPFSHGHASGTWTYAASLWGIHFALMLLGGRVVICSRDPST